MLGEINRVDSASLPAEAGAKRMPEFTTFDDSGRLPTSAQLLVADTASTHSTRLVAKRILDITVALLLAPFALVIVALASAVIVIVDRHAPFFVDRRVGRMGRQFGCLKLRTLRSDPALFDSYLAAHPEEAYLYEIERKLEHDPRKTSVGNVLRKLSVDELPQLINVLGGQMSLVGPRPLSPREFDARGSLGESLEQVKPGITGLWQVSGRSDLSHEDRVALDDWYARFWSLGLDLSIMLHTPLAVLRHRGTV